MAAPDHRTTRLVAFAVAAAALSLGWATTASAATASDQDDAHRPMTRQEVEAWLDSRGMPTTQQDDGGDVAEAPPPPPRHHGFVVETGLGAMQHLGPLKHISPLSPLFHLQFGWEPIKWAMIFAETDLSFGNTSYARPPPEPRGYAMYGFGGGLRFTVKPTDRFGIYLQGSVGAAKISDDVLVTYGYRDATSFNPYFGGVLGLEWYQVNPHTALALFGGVRNYNQLLDRTGAAQTALAVIGGVSLRYVF